MALDLRNRGLWKVNNKLKRMFTSVIRVCDNCQYLSDSTCLGNSGFSFDSTTETFIILNRLY